MSNFNARRAPNVSQYLANLNTIPSAQDLAAQNDFVLGDDGLDFLTNAEFFDFDNFDGDVGAFPPVVPAELPQKSVGNRGVVMGGMHAQLALDMSTAPVPGLQYQFGEFQTYPPMSTPSTIPTSPTTGLQGVYPGQPHPFAQQVDANTGDKRSASIAGISPSGDMEEGPRVAAEEDKRRRNTAASARFRVKKKQREQALEKQAKELSDKVLALEGKVGRLETENKWLKGLITGKAKVEATVTAEKKESEKEGEERSTESRTDGVGTGLAGAKA